MAGTSADKLNYLLATKEAIRQAIYQKGVDIPETTPFRQYAGKIAEIQTGSFETQTVSDSFYITQDNPFAEDTLSIPDGWAAVGYDLYSGSAVKSTYATYDRASNIVTYGGEYTGTTSAQISIEVITVKTM